MDWLGNPTWISAPICLPGILTAAPYTGNSSNSISNSFDAGPITVGEDGLPGRYFTIMVIMQSPQSSLNPELQIPSGNGAFGDFYFHPAVRGRAGLLAFPYFMAAFRVIMLAIC